MNSQSPGGLVAFVCKDGGWWGELVGMRFVWISMVLTSFPWSLGISRELHVVGLLKQVTRFSVFCRRSSFPGP